VASYREIFRCASAKAQIFSQKYSKRSPDAKQNILEKFKQFLIKSDKITPLKSKGS
jgi:hypothetical protein